MLVKLAKHYGVSKIIGTVGDLSKKDYVLSIGADDMFTYDSFVDGVKQHTNGKGAQVIFDSVAGDVTKASLECLANFGTLVQFGNSSGKAGCNINKRCAQQLPKYKRFQLRYNS